MAKNINIWTSTCPHDLLTLSLRVNMLYYRNNFGIREKFFFLKASLNVETPKKNHPAEIQFAKVTCISKI